MMELTGNNFIGNNRSSRGRQTFQASNPATNEKLSPAYYEALSEEIDEAIEKAEQAFSVYSKKSGEAKAVLLETIADEIVDLGDILIERCKSETGLPEGRLTGERGRTVNQLRLFAKLLREGSWVEARIDTADPDRQPAPKPDVRSMQTAIGPVGVFGASNFPFAFSVAGGDTASALAAGCPVVVKAHHAHPGTCELVAQAITRAVEKTGMPDGTFSMVQGASNEVGLAIVNHPLIKAIGFTGSFKGGKALYDAAAKRPEPIPVYAEMSSTNPVFILPGALKKQKDEVAKGLAASATLGVGQFCTAPGLTIFEDSEDGRKFQNAVANNMKTLNTGPMLTAGIYNAYNTGIERMQEQRGVKVMAHGSEGETGNSGTPYLMHVEARDFLVNKSLEEEVFGPSTLAVTTSGKHEMVSIAQNLGGHLTATLYGTEEDLKNNTELVDVLRRKVGRLIFNGFPTGVEVCHAMVHGGPFPATTDSRSTSVGTAAILRFTRPVSYQNFPDTMLPDELKHSNPLNIWRLEDGEWKKA